MDPKRVAENLINTAKGLLRSCGVVAPGLFVFSRDSVTCVGVNEQMSKEYQDAFRYDMDSELSDLMGHLIDKDTKALFLILQSEDTILNLLFTIDKTYCRKVSYIKDIDVTIADFGWSEDTANCSQCRNPFKHSKLQD
jgi:hypothetical protein